jgi:hypothetical protein
VAAPAGGTGPAGRIRAGQGGGRGAGSLNADKTDQGGAGPGHDAGGGGLGAPALPATPRSGSLSTGRPRSTPPAATASESPASKRALPGEEPMARNRLDFGPLPPSAGGADAVTPAAATAKGPDIGPTPAHPALLAGSPETSSLAPLSGVLDYEPAGAGAGAGLDPDSEGANPPITPPRPPRPPDRGRERESYGTPSSVLKPPRKRLEGAGPPLAARQGLSFPATAASARSAACESPAARSGGWTAYSMRDRLNWTAQSNVKGVEAATAEVKHYL